MKILLLFLAELLSERCRADDLAPKLPILGLVWTPKFWGWTSSSTVLSQVVLGHPASFLQSAGGRNAAAMTLHSDPPADC